MTYNSSRPTYSSRAHRDCQDSLALLSGACAFLAIDTFLLWCLRFALQFLVLVPSEMFLPAAGLTGILSYDRGRCIDCQQTQQSFLH
jgi:hypothetical protein